MKKRFAMIVVCIVMCMQLISCGGNTSTGDATLLGTLGPSGVRPGSLIEYEVSRSIELMFLSLVAYEQLTQCVDSGTSAITVPAPYTLVKVYYENVGPNADKSCKNDVGKVPIAFIATKGDAIYLVFRGTDTPTEDILDAEISQTPYTFVANGGSVEYGFNQLYEQIHAGIIADMLDLIDSGNYSTIYVTGHSLGAGLAVMVVPELADQSSTLPTILYTFAGPAVGNRAFKALYETSLEGSFRVANTNDVVPKLPPQGLINCPNLYYIHVLAQVDITFGVSIANFPDFSSTCSIPTIEAVLGLFLAVNEDAVLTNHDSCTYYSTLCDQTDDPDACRNSAKGIHGCFE